MKEVVALAISLHYICALLVVDVAHRRPRVRADALAVQPRDVGAPHGVVRQRAEAGEVEGLGGDAGPVAEDAPAGRGGEHGVAEAVDEVRRRRCFGEGGDQV